MKLQLTSDSKYTLIVLYAVIHSLAVKTPVLLFRNDIITARYKAVILAYLPNKRILFLFVFILIIFAGWFYFSSYKNRQIQYTAEKEKSPLAVALSQTSQLDADTDGDGLKDWEELLWKTDPNNIDTDGDGTNDNEEITLGRNPLKAGPDDKISGKEDLVAQEKAASDENSKQNILTAVYARKFFADYMALKTQKGVLTDLDKEKLVDSLMFEIENNFKTKDVYGISNIKIIDSQKINLKEYSQKIKKILIEDKLINENETVVFNRLLENFKNKASGENYGADVKKLLNIAEIYHQASISLVSIETPDKLIKEHLLVVNNLNNMGEEVKLMASAINDPINGWAGFRLYKQEVVDFSNNFEDLKENLKEKNIFILD